MLGLVSTSGRDFRPASAKTPQDHARDARRHADEAQRQYEIVKEAKRELDSIALKAAERRKLEKELKGIQDRIAEKAAVHYPEHPPRPRKPKDPGRGNGEWEKTTLLNAREQYELGVLDRNQFMGLLKLHEEHDLGSDMATVGYHRAPNLTYHETPSAPACRVCNERGYVSTHYVYPGPVEASCDACNARWYADDPAI